MSKRYALLYCDGSLNVHKDNLDLAEAKRMLGKSGDDDDTELVEIELKILHSFGPKEAAKKQDCSVTCPTCQTEIEITPGEKQ